MRTTTQPASIRSKAALLAIATALSLPLYGLAAPTDEQGPPPPRQRDPDGGRPVEQIAKELGVTPEEFREAFKKVRPARPGEAPTREQREANRAALSEALGVSPERLDEVMDKYRPGGRGTNGPTTRPQNGRGQDGPPPRGERRGPPIEQIARDLDISVEKVRDAFSKVPRPEAGGPPSEEQKAECQRILSEELGVSQETIAVVLEKNRPQPGDNAGGQQRDGNQRPPRRNEQQSTAGDQQRPPQDGQRRPPRQNQQQ